MKCSPPYELCNRWRFMRIESYASFYSTFIIILDIIFRIIFFTAACGFSAVTRFLYRRNGSLGLLWRGNICSIYSGHSPTGCKAKVMIIETIYYFTTWEIHSWWASFGTTSQHIFWRPAWPLRELDIIHKDKQNFEAVLRITSDSVMQLLTNVRGTMMYLRIMKLVTETGVS